MPALLKPDPRRPDRRLSSRMASGILASCVLLFLYGVSTTVHATQVTITSVDSRVQNEILVIDADINFELGEDVVEALENGITLTFYIEIEFYRPRSFIWDKELAHFTKNLQLAYHSLSGQYLLTNLITADQQSFNSLYDALLVLGNISGLPIIETKYIDQEMSATGRIQTGIDIEKLPAVMRLQAWLSSDWRRDSGWHEWEIYP